MSTIPKDYALARVLEHGPMTFAELVDCTRWAVDELQAVLNALMAAGRVRRLSLGRAGNCAFEACRG